MEGSIKRHIVLLIQYSFVTLLSFNSGKELTNIRNQKAPTQPLFDAVATL